jgi:hypothetical protein
MISKVNHAVTQLNAITACAPLGAKTPLILPNDREAITAGLSTCLRRPQGPLVAHIRDTLMLENLALSEAFLPAARDMERLEVLSQPEPMQFEWGTLDALALSDFSRE